MDPVNSVSQVNTLIFIITGVRMRGAYLRFRETILSIILRVVKQFEWIL